MIQDCFSPKVSFKRAGVGKLRLGEKAGLLQVRCQTNVNLKFDVNLKPVNTCTRLSASRMSGVATLKQTATSDINVNRYFNLDNAFITTRYKLNPASIFSRPSTSAFVSARPHKIAGTHDSYRAFDNFVATEKLYPSGIEVFESGFNRIIGIASSIDDGVLTGNYLKNGLPSSRVSRDSIFLRSQEQFGKPTEDHNNYKLVLEMDKPSTDMLESFLAIRIDAPVENFRSHKPLSYKFHNLKFTDPSGNLIIQYKDFIVRGESKYLSTVNPTTYLTEPLTNNAKLDNDDSDYPLFINESGYLLNIDVETSTSDDPFDGGFTKGFSEDNRPLYGRREDFRIISLEILSQGVSNLRSDAILPFSVQVPATGLRTERKIFPSNLLKYNFDTTIYPSGEHSLWKDDGNNTFNDAEDNSYLSNLLRLDDNDKFIELSSTTTVADSGKLKLKFSHETPTSAFKYADGAFQFAFESDSFVAAGKRQVSDTDSFFVVDDIELKVTAKKSASSRDYVIDVVGYSDDKLLHITPKIGGFLQNASGQHPSGIGVAPVSSGFANINDLGISTLPISDKFSYFETSGTNNLGGNHYSLPLTPIVNTTEFTEYTIPLDIYPDNVRLGKSVDYSMSSYFEHLYLDLFPFPSGAAISNISLLIKYRPSNALPLHTIAHEKEPLHRSRTKGYPSSSQSTDRKINSIIQNSGLSLIESIPHGYQSPTTIKTNYARRWRGVGGNVMTGPFQPTVFDFSFENPQLDTPFINGAFDFTKIEDGFVLPNQSGLLDNNVSGFYNASFSSNIIENIGLRFNSSGLFVNQQRDYKTLDWTQTGSELSGKILDSFDKALRLSGPDANINFGSGISVSGGFAAYIRFSPDVSISGSSYNLWDSGVLLSKWNQGEELEFLLAYSGGHLAARARDINNNTISIYDSQDYTNYQYPLSVLLTYNDNLSSGLKLYADSEIASGSYDLLRASSTPFFMASGNSPIVAGFSSASGVGTNVFVTDIGLSFHNASGSNIRESGINLDMKQTDVEDFFSGHRAKFWNAGESNVYDRYKLWSFVDQNTDKWNIGDFNLCMFDQSFSRFTKRVGRDYIQFKLSHSGFPYYQTTNLALPSGSIQTSGLAYHSQLENDMLRLDIGTIPDGDSHRLYSASPRISKNFPRGYKFEESAFVVDTVIQSQIDQEVNWNDGNTGPKLIVSLYAPQKDPTTYVESNFGLVNRHYHYLPSNGCMKKISSTFDYNDWIDKSEPWAEFNSRTASTEFDHKFYSDDIDKMFIQYDIAFPSGDKFTSNIKLHAINLNLENVLASGDTVESSGFALYASGNTISANALELFVDALVNISGAPPSGLTLYSSGAAIPTVSGESPSGLLMSTLAYDPSTVGRASGMYLGSGLSLFSSGDGTIGFDPSLIIHEGMYGVVNTDFNPAVNLFTEGGASGVKVSDGALSISTFNDGILDSTSGDLFLFNQSAGLADPVLDSGNITMFLHGVPQLNPFIELVDTIPLYLAGLDFNITSSGSLDLRIIGQPIINGVNNDIHLFTTSYNVAPGDLGQEFINWTNINTGTGILTVENDYSYLESNDEIRGVDLTCYGDCDSTDEPCIDPEIIIHGKNFGQDCVDGGIFRAKRLYTNLATSGFKTDIGYSGNYYGIRKLTGLIPHAPYDIKVVGRTAGEERKELPRSLSIGYGTNENVHFSGIKLIADGIQGASGNVPPSSTTPRNALDEYGKAVKISEDYMVVGSPKHNIVDYASTNLGNAGTVFLYKRNAIPSGHDWSTQDDKAGFSFVSELSLPEGLKRDYSVPKVVREDPLNASVSLPFPTTQTNWYNIGEGRNFGSSVDISSSGGSPTIVVGAPNSVWSRTFTDPVPDPIEVALLIFTRPFVENQPVRTTGREAEATVIHGFRTYRDILPRLNDVNFLYKYYSNPAVAINLKIIVVEPNITSGPVGDQTFIGETEDTAFKFSIFNHERGNFRGQIHTTHMVQQLQELFHGPVSGIYPFDDSKPNSGIPVIVGALIDDSISMGQEVLGELDSDAVDQFFDWYKGYSLASGVKNFDNQPSAGSTFRTLSSKGEGWIKQSIDLIDEVFDTGRMAASEDFKLFSTSIGTFNNNTAKFNISPPSGGAVFVFEEENNDGTLEFNPVQMIDSPTQSRNIHPDRFAHDVAISHDKSTIVIGSPYMQQAVRIYEKDNFIIASDYVGNWINRVGQNDQPFGYLRDKYRRYQELVPALGASQAGKVLFDELNASGKLQLRIDEDIRQYKLVKEYKYSDMKPTVPSEWEFLYSQFAPTPRLGYSVDTNEDGSIVAAGAPTDSVLNKFNDFAVWWRPGATHTSQWFSSTNAGSVTVFESRKYYPHANKAVEYTRLGNKHRMLNEDDQNEGLFSHMNAIYNNVNIEFSRLEENQVDIPNDAGLMFMITPAVDGLSDEIVENIQNWLGLGDRHLVLVADDPIYEADGAYETTNNIVNELLKKLDSRMEVVPSRNDYESLIGSNRKDGKPFKESDFNIQESYAPTGTTFYDYFSPNSLRGSGVADIKLNYPGIYEAYNCSERSNIFFETDAAGNETGGFPTYQELNNRCKMIPQHGGDLRAEYNDFCENPIGLGYIVYPVNLALAFGTATTTSYGCCVSDCPPPKATVNMEPIPLLVASEHVLENKIIKGIPEKIIKVPVVVGHELTARPTFSETCFSEASFYWTGDSNNYNAISYNLGFTTSPSRFITENETILDKTNLLRSESHVEGSIVNLRNPIDHFNYIAKENYGNTTSEVYIIGGTETELERFIMDSQVQDKNILLYRSLLKKVGEESQFLDRVAQLGGWTNRTTFKDGREDSYLEELFGFLPPDVAYNVDDLENHILTSTYDAAWIANTDQIIPSEDLNVLKAWLSQGNRKLFITCGRETSGDDETFESSNIPSENIAALDALVVALNLNIKPLRLPIKDKVASVKDFFPAASSRFVGFGELDNATNEFNVGNIFELIATNAISVDIRNGGERVLGTNEQGRVNPRTDPSLLTDDKFEIIGAPYFKTGVTKVTFPVLPGSGYRIFLDTMSTNPDEKHQLRFQFSNCNRQYGVLSSGNSSTINDVVHIPNDINHNREDKVIATDFVGALLGTNRGIGTISNPEKEIGYRLSSQFNMAFDGSVNTQEINLYIPSGDGSDHDNVNKIKELSIYIDSNNIHFPLKQEGYDKLPKTQRLVGISGCLVPEEVLNLSQPIWGSEDLIIPAVPDQVLTVTESRPISTESIKYCPTDECKEIFTARDENDKIADGPVVAAQELYFQKPFDVGVNRSRITVLTDASMIQGRRIADEGGVIDKNIISFLRSLYPHTDFPGEDEFGENTEGAVNTYNIINKITAPVKGSPHKFFNSTGNSGQMIRFAGDGTPATSGRAMSFFSDDIDNSTIVSRTGFPKSPLPIEIGKGAEKLIPKDPPYADADQIIQMKLGAIAAFESAQYSYGGTAKFSGVVDGELYGDSYYAEMPQIIKDKGYDYLDLEKFPSGYPGDLFGYSVAIQDKTVVIGSPFAAFSSETPTTWSYVSGVTVKNEQASGTVLGYGGGAGSAFLYGKGERTLSDYGVTGGSTNWELIKKFRPQSINVGQDLCLDGINETSSSQAVTKLGTNNYKIADLRDNSFVTDQFGAAVDIHGDTIVVGAPGHDFPNLEQMEFERGGEASGAFNHKEFNLSIDIPLRTVYDVGESGLRYQLSLSGSGTTAVLNNGAAYVYEIINDDWEARTKGCSFVQKIVPKGYFSRVQKDYEGTLIETPVSGSENDYYGRSVSVYQANRVDSNYSIAVGVPAHMCATSGDHSSFASGVNTGAVYISDGMLREPNSTLPNPDASIFATVYANSGIDRSDPNGDYISLHFTNSGVYDYIFESSGRLYTNEDGEIFLEASGQDPADRSFTAHRPLIQEITGKYVHGTPEKGLLRLFASGQGPIASGSLPLYNQAKDSAIVYNNLGLYASASLGSVSGVFEGSGLTLYSSGVLGS